MRRIYYISLLLIVLIVSFLGITYSFEYGEENNLSFELIGPTTFYLDVGTEYTEYGIKVNYNGHDVSDDVIIDKSLVDTDKLGKYLVKYEYNGEYIYRNVVVIDKEEPVINLVGGDEISILLGGNYQEPGYIVIDNYDVDLNNLVTISGSVNTNVEGTYKITYKVSDNSGNIGEATRIVNVKKAVISVNTNYGNNVSNSNYNASLYSNAIVKNSFNISGIRYEGYVKDNADKYKIKLKNKVNDLEYSYVMTKTKNNYYNGNISLTNVANGSYDVYIIGNKEERLINKLDILSRIVRAKVGNKLVTVTYDYGYVNIKVEDFKYRYDIAIDPGHGGSDTGTSNGLIIEKNLNLKISKYEKCRYQSMGYKVYMVRYDDSLGEMLGDNSLDPLDRRSLTMGYYGVVSKIVYSNHHNGAMSAGRRGFELIVSNQITPNDLEPELDIINGVKNIYNNRVAMYSRDYDNGMVYDKLSGETYNRRNYYSMIRIPYELYNVKNVIYEPIYMTNASDFNWYYAGNNWIKISELKIEKYVKYLGGKYNSDNKKCL